MGFEKIFRAAVKQYGFEKAISEIGYGLLRRIGLLWLTDHLIPAQEHFASNLIKNILINSIENLPKVHNDSSAEILLFTPTGEFHEIPLLFAHWLFKKNGKKVCYLGSNTSTEELFFCLKKRQVSHLFFHLITNLTGKTFDEYTLDMLNCFPDQKLVVSSAKFKSLTIQSPNLIVLKSLEDLIDFTARFKNQVLHS
jgi:hypothetical protein